jgi:hypothetical protein
VTTVLKAVLGDERKGWKSERRPSNDGTRNITWIVPIAGSE